MDGYHDLRNVCRPQGAICGKAPVDPSLKHRLYTQQNCTLGSNFKKTAASSSSPHTITWHRSNNCGGPPSTLHTDSTSIHFRSTGSSQWDDLLQVHLCVNHPQKVLQENWVIPTPSSWPLPSWGIRDASEHRTNFAEQASSLASNGNVDGEICLGRLPRRGEDGFHPYFGWDSSSS